MTSLIPDHRIPTRRVWSVPSVRRLDAMDSAKGIGIILVVFGHAWRGAMGAGVIADDVVFRTIDFAVYAFHMPLFFFLSGLLFLETLQKYGTLSLLQGRVSRLLWPMALWTWLFFGLKLFAGQSANTPVSFANFPIIPLPPYEHLWFLWALFVCQSGLILIYNAANKRVSATTWRWVAGAGAVSLAALNPFFVVPSLLFGPLIEHTPYFLAGIAAGGFIALRPPLWAALASGGAFAVLIWMVQVEKAAVFHSLVLVGLAWSTWLAIDQNGDNRVLRLLRVLGKASMVIYLTHTIFTAALRILMLKIDVDTPVAVLSGTVFIGLIAPFAVAWAARHLRMTKLLGL